MGEVPDRTGLQEARHDAARKAAETRRLSSGIRGPLRARRRTQADGPVPQKERGGQKGIDKQPGRPRPSEDGQTFEKEFFP